MSDFDTAKHLLPFLMQACEKYSHHADFPAAIVNISKQVLYLFSNNKFVCSYPVSTSRHGAGQQEGSNRTPIGVHCIKEKIGEDAEFAEIFSSRVRTHAKATIEHEAVCTEEECITSRILWLDGLEEGINKGQDDKGNSVDSFARYIYIHGTHEEGLIGKAASIGCIRMNNKDVIDLFDRVSISSLVIIQD